MFYLANCLLSGNLSFILAIRRLSHNAFYIQLMDEQLAEVDWEVCNLMDEQLAGVDWEVCNLEESFEKLQTILVDANAEAHPSRKTYRCNTHSASSTTRSEQIKTRRGWKPLH